MKKIILMLLLFISTDIVFAQSLAQNSKTENFTLETPVFLWNETTFNFAEVKLNEPVTHEFYFTNAGKASLIISSVRASCGCTVTEYSKDPVPPGQRGYVKASYNAAKLGVFNKTITVNSNTDELVVLLTIKGEVRN